VGLPIAVFTAPRWRALLARASALGWHVEVHRLAADLPAIIPALLDESCRVVFDHFGRPAPHLGTLDPVFLFVLSIA
ncbi:amidohydrolase family protein, partial [Burkholderia pseudomallei]